MVMVLELIAAARGIIILIIIFSIRLYRTTLIQVIRRQQLTIQPFKTFAIENFLCSQKNMELASSIL